MGGLGFLGYVHTDMFITAHRVEAVFVMTLHLQMAAFHVPELPVLSRVVTARPVQHICPDNISRYVIINNSQVCSTHIPGQCLKI